MSPNAPIDWNDRRKAKSGALFHRLRWYVSIVKMSVADKFLCFRLTGDDVVFLDPHLTQNAIEFDDEEFEDSSYHPTTSARISFHSMDPSLAVVKTK